MITRDTLGLIVPLLLPLAIMLMGASQASQEVVVNGRTVLDVYVMPIVFVMIVAFIGVGNMPSFLASYRRTGVLKRLSTTPLSPIMVLAAQVLVSFAQAVIGMALAFGVAVAAFGANLPVHLWTALGVIALIAGAMYGFGMIIASLAPTPNSATALGFIGFIGLGALGGMFGSREALPEPLATIGEYLPFGAGVEALGAAWAGSAIEPLHLIALAITAVVGALVSALFFRWE